MPSLRKRKGDNMSWLECAYCGTPLGAASGNRPMICYYVEEACGERYYFCELGCCQEWCRERIKEGGVLVTPLPGSLPSGWKKTLAVASYEGCKRHLCEASVMSPPARFICPGCGERATARGGSLCPNCNCFVHHDCAIKGFVTWSCPVCNVGLVGQT